jgi:hypothetical protein
MSYTLKHTAEELDHKLDLIDINRNLLPYPYNITFPASLKDIGDGSILTMSNTSSKETIFLTASALLPAGNYIASIEVENAEENPGFKLSIKDANDIDISLTDSGKFTLVNDTVIKVSLTTPENGFGSGIVIKPQIEAGTLKTNWVPYMRTIGSYVDERFNGTTARINALTEHVDAETAEIKEDIEELSDLIAAGGGGGGGTGGSYTADNELLKLSGSKFTTNIIHKGTSTNSFEIFDGVASAEYSIAAGTSEKDAIIPIVGSTLANMIKVNAPTASGIGAIATGGGAEATSAGALAMGSLNRVGVTGFYWSNIVWNTDGSAEITLSTSQGSAAWNFSGTFNWDDGDTISIVNDTKHPACATIVGTPTTNANGQKVITVDKLPFTEKKTPSTVLPDDYTIFACYKKDIATEGFGANLVTLERWYPRSGTVTIGWAGTAFGIENLVSGSAGFAVGWNNWTAGDFGAAFGRDNIAGYTSFAAGRENEVTSANCFAAGYLNKVKSNNSGAIGYNNKVSKSNSGSFIVGQNNTSSAPFQLIVGDGAQTSWKDQDTGESRTFGGHFLVAASGAQADIATKPWMANVFAVSNNGTASARRFSTCSEPVRQRKAISNDIQKDYSAAIGSKLTITNSYCLAAGINNTISAARAAAIGGGLLNKQATSVVIGQANEENTDRVFAIGWGSLSGDGLTVNSRKTILTVNQNKIGGSGAKGCYSKADRPSDVVTLGYLQNDFSGGSGIGLPDCSGYQDGAILVVRNGQWVIENPPTTVYTGEVK